MILRSFTFCLFFVFFCGCFFCYFFVIVVVVFVVVVFRRGLFCFVFVNLVNFAIIGA